MLYKYGHTLGLWQAEISHYGGLIQVKWTGQSLLCIQHQPPINPHVDKPLRAKPLFSIKLNYEKEVEILCLQGFFGPHQLVVNQVIYKILIILIELPWFWSQYSGWESLSPESELE